MIRAQGRCNDVFVHMDIIIYNHEASLFPTGGTASRALNNEIS